MASPTELSLRLLRKQGFFCEITEKNMRIPPKEPGREPLVYKVDLFGFIDILAIKPGITLAVQTTSASNVAARIAKITALGEFDHVKRAGWIVYVHGWHGKRMEDGLRMIDMTNMATSWSSIVKRGGRNRKTPRRQGELRLPGIGERVVRNREEKPF